MLLEATDNLTAHFHLSSNILAMAQRMDPPPSEEMRLQALTQLGLLDTPPSESVDRITRMASRMFGLPIAAVSLTDRDRQWFK